MWINRATLRVRIFLPMLVCSVVLAGCGQRQASRTRTEARNPTNLPPELAEYVKTSEGKRMMEMVRKWKEQIDHTKETLLHKTDHGEILSASREVIRTRRDFKRDPKWRGGSDDPDKSLIAPDDPKLPLALRKLGAASMFGHDDRLRIEFGGGFHHYGLIAYSASATDNPTGLEGHKKLIDGLWFYEETH